MKYKNIREEELKNKVAADWFKQFDTTEIIGNIDFAVFPKKAGIFERTPLLWAEAKTGDYDLVAMFVQLILTIGKARTFDKTLPPPFLAVFDFKKIVFIPYISVQDIFYMNDFNWNVAPSNHESKEFKLINDRIEKTLEQNTYVFDYLKDEKEIKHFIANNLAYAVEISKVKIDKNNFVHIYLRWLDIIKPLIDVNWEDIKKVNLLDSDFYLADLFVDDKDTQQIDDDTSIQEKLFIIFEKEAYRIPREFLKTMFDASINIKNKEAYKNFWKRYKRPPLSEFQDYIIERRDLLVPQDIRERKGAFFTPRQWVELSQKYLADVLGKDWQEEYYIWDCAAGTGNLLAGLTNKFNIYASTLDQADVNVMHERIEHGTNLLKNHVFQFDFLNDDFSKLPQPLQDIINNPEKRKKLVIYINPPYAEATNARTVTGTGENRSGVATNHNANQYFKTKIGNATNEVSALFMAQVYDKMPASILGIFDKPKFIQGSNFRKFKEYFLADYLGGFVIPADTFDNVKGKFPIGFTIWNTATKLKINTIKTDVYDKNGNLIASKNFYGTSTESINNWLVNFYLKQQESNIGTLSTRGNDFQNQKYIYIATKIENNTHDTKVNISNQNIIPICIYFSVRHCMPATWLNDRDQFLSPNKKWEKDKEFQNDCLAFALFHSQNKVASKDGINHWIPFKEQEVNPPERFRSSFMTDFIKGKIQPDDDNHDIFTVLADQKVHYEVPLSFSPEALAVFDAGLKLWKYYFSFNAIIANAGLYDIKEFFQGRNNKGRMSSKSTDEKYNKLIGELREKLYILASKIAPKVYEYGFLRE